MYCKSIEVQILYYLFILALLPINPPTQERAIGSTSYDTQSEPSEVVEIKPPTQERAMGSSTSYDTQSEPSEVVEINLASIEKPLLEECVDDAGKSRRKDKDNFLPPRPRIKDATFERRGSLM